MSFRLVVPSLPPHRPSTRDDDTARREGATGGLTLRVNLRTPALRIVITALVVVAGRCTLHARVETVPLTPPAAAVALAAEPGAALPTSRGS